MGFRKGGDAIKLLISSDWHPDRVTAGISRFDEVQAAVDVTVAQAVEHCVDAYLWLGDLCDPGGMRSYRAIAMLMRAVIRLNSHGIDFVGITGNHDVIDDGSGSSVLTPLKELTLDDVFIVDAPRMVELYTRSGEVQTLKTLKVLCLPFTPRSHSYDPEEVVAQCEEADIVMGHLNIEGITPGSETTDMPRGREVFFPYKSVRNKFPNALLLNGHYHKGTVWKGKAGRFKQGITIPGSLARLTFGEEHIMPRYLIVEAS